MMFVCLVWALTKNKKIKSAKFKIHNYTMKILWILNLADFIFLFFVKARCVDYAGVHIFKYPD